MACRLILAASGVGQLVLRVELPDPDRAGIRGAFSAPAAFPGVAAGGSPEVLGNSCPSRYLSIEPPGRRMSTDHSLQRTDRFPERGLLNGFPASLHVRDPGRPAPSLQGVELLLDVLHRAEDARKVTPAEPLATSAVASR